MSDTSERNSLSLPLSTDLGQDFYTYLHTNFETIDAALAKCNFAGGATPPDADNDEGEGYAIGSKWFTDTAIFVCMDDSEGAAVWKRVWPSLAADMDLSAYILADGSRALSASLIMAQIATPAAPAEGYTKIYVKADGKLYRRAYGGSETEVGVVPDLTPYMLKSIVDAKGDLITATADDTPTRLAVGSNGQSLLANSGASAGLSWIDRAPGLYYNACINSQFQINQRAATAYTATTTPANNDDTYLMDQWVLLSDGNDIVDVSQETSIVPPGAPSSLKFEVETANKKFAIIQFIESIDAVKFAGKIVSLQLKARTTTGKVIENIRAAILSWDGTADTITSDVISAWGNEGENPTLVANWTMENAPANLALVADAWTTYKIENISIDTSGMKNLAIIVWIDDTDAAVDDLLYISDIQLNEGLICLPYAPKSIASELIVCERYLRVIKTTGLIPIAMGIAATTSLCSFAVLVPSMRVPPTTTLIGTPGTDYDLRDIAGNYMSITGMQAYDAIASNYITFRAVKSEGLTLNALYRFYLKTTSGMLIATAEL